MLSGFDWNTPSTWLIQLDLISFRIPHLDVFLRMVHALTHPDSTVIITYSSPPRASLSSHLSQTERDSTFSPEFFSVFAHRRAFHIISDQPIVQFDHTEDKPATSITRAATLVHSRTAPEPHSIRGMHSSQGSLLLNAGARVQALLSRHGLTHAVQVPPGAALVDKISTDVSAGRLDAIRDETVSESLGNQLDGPSFRPVGTPDLHSSTVHVPSFHNCEDDDFLRQYSDRSTSSISGSNNPHAATERSFALPQRYAASAATGLQMTELAVSDAGESDHNVITADAQCIGPAARTEIHEGEPCSVESGGSTGVEVETMTKYEGVTTDTEADDKTKNIVQRGQCTTDDSAQETSRSGSPVGEAEQPRGEVHSTVATSTPGDASSTLTVRTDAKVSGIDSGEDKQSIVDGREQSELAFESQCLHRHVQFRMEVRTIPDEVRERGVAGIVIGSDVALGEWSASLACRMYGDLGNVNDVLIGDVWIESGKSEIEYKYAAVNHLGDVVAWEVGGNRTIQDGREGSGGRAGPGEVEVFEEHWRR